LKQPFDGRVEMRVEEVTTHVDDVERAGVGHLEGFALQSWQGFWKRRARALQQSTAEYAEFTGQRG